ncbi:DNA polymerase epsilon subunit 3 [Biomphalaria glabrata]|uniref:DNA polymerase epsilon subunit 3 n=3 Tax=Biomphalaria TaxID=6525 RepID=A0A2C9M5R2_BIOGL|nr:DNA polymerase epsilon subunit 3-like [Biomphalaria glabrata]XP_055896188.1 DNA polymerase epsilon subunit 3-like [Biomphalaria glabrata]XP_055896189.1 DNA polymerase epsilon subunit 3-like [Biomphalaria glabrata]KAK0053827.1 DNA polymerase epsilon subunit 3 [Biomphalaria pfeifferi]KAI8730106.1 DNA polymerase epsilon subunit 3-like [Biomphalaria glabrata]KAI8750649.1 DNA polymerase epsilon subunit 3 [Biomphalaria glabrata]
MAERPEDLNLPNAVVSRIIKDAIPEGVNVSKEARLAISKAASVFVLYATSCSNNFAIKNKRKTITAQDVLNAMEDMEFEQFIEPLQQCQEAFRLEKLEKKKEKTQKTPVVPTPVLEVDEAEDKDVEEVSDSSDEGEEVQKKKTGKTDKTDSNEEEEEFQITINNDYDSESPEIVDDEGD